MILYSKANRGFWEKLYRLKEHETTVKTEIIAGFTTFMTMAYIIVVNPLIMQDAGMDFGASKAKLLDKEDKIPGVNRGEGSLSIPQLKSSMFHSGNLQINET